MIQARLFHDDNRVVRQMLQECQDSVDCISLEDLSSLGPEELVFLELPEPRKERRRYRCLARASIKQYAAASVQRLGLIDESGATGRIVVPTYLPGVDLEDRDLEFILRALERPASQGDPALLVHVASVSEAPARRILGAHETAVHVYELAEAQWERQLWAIFDEANSYSKSLDRLEAISNKKLQKIMTLPINQIFRYLQNRSRVQVWLHEQSDLRIEGRILGFDEYMNLVIDDAEEIMVKKKTRRAIGRILLKGDNICLMMNTGPRHLQQLRESVVQVIELESSAPATARTQAGPPTLLTSAWKTLNTSPQPKTLNSPNILPGKSTTIGAFFANWNPLPRLNLSEYEYTEQQLQDFEQIALNVNDNISSIIEDYRYSNSAKSFDDSPFRELRQTFTADPNHDSPILPRIRVRPNILVPTTKNLHLEGWNAATSPVSVYSLGPHFRCESLTILGQVLEHLFSPHLRHPFLEWTDYNVRKLRREGWTNQHSSQALHEELSRAAALRKEKDISADASRTEAALQKERVISADVWSKKGSSAEKLLKSELASAWEAHEFRVSEAAAARRAEEQLRQQVAAHVRAVAQLEAHASEARRSELNLRRQLEEAQRATAGGAELLQQVLETQKAELRAGTSEVESLRRSLLDQKSELQAGSHEVDSLRESLESQKAECSAIECLAEAAAAEAQRQEALRSEELHVALRQHETAIMAAAQISIAALQKLRGRFGGAASKVGKTPTLESALDAVTQFVNAQTENSGSDELPRPQESEGKIKAIGDASPAVNMYEADKEEQEEIATEIAEGDMGEVSEEEREYDVAVDEPAAQDTDQDRREKEEASSVEESSGKPVGATPAKIHETKSTELTEMDGIGKVRSSRRSRSRSKTRRKRGGRKVLGGQRKGGGSLGSSTSSVRTESL
ncbi:unnamed protein product [Polarella glacialis]|uniref:Probable small nuclear ribonucleoprotein E n=1 Tax=Polarella glacialis TaxID=89957 RepID=A0A813M526_POLGL|nr:unnamed protein product [Polarella glacialis]